MLEPAADRYAAPVGGVMAPPGASEGVGLPGAHAPATVEAAVEALEASPTKRLGFVGWFSILWMGGITLLALVAPWLPLPDPDKSFLEIALVDCCLGCLEGRENLKPLPDREMVVLAIFEGRR